MAIFNKSDDKPSKPNSNTSGTTVVADGTKIKGDIVIECNLHIDGEFEGLIKSDKNVTIGKTGCVKGEIYSDKLIISGSFNGKVDSDIVDVLPNGKLFGSVLANEFVIERGGFFEGESKTKDAIKIENKKPLIIESVN
jgi:cytoskeletal protein CcmA (bactofilin family)